MHDLNKTISLVITGRVQGVWFRASTKNEADKLGINGFTKNMPDGTVYIEASGSQHQLDAFTKWCGVGPDLARVDNVEVQHIAQLHTQGFEVRRT